MTGRGKDTVILPFLPYAAWYGHPAEHGVLYTGVILPRGTLSGRKLLKSYTLSSFFRNVDV